MLVVAVLSGCAKKQENVAMAAYEEQITALETLFSDETLDEETAEVRFDSIKEAMLGLAEESSHVALRLFEDRLVAYLSLAQKERLFAAVNHDTLAAHGFEKAYKRYQAELKTQGGCPMIDIVCATPKGDTLRLSDVVAKHKYVLLDFWASWCRPCRELMPSLKELYAAHRDQLEIVSVSIDTDLEAWKAMINKLELPWLHGAVQLARPGSEPAEEYGVSYVPTLFLIGQDGTIIAREPEIEKIEW
jgi:thiol-disulfide isomerase/thioredoxin